MSGDNMAVEGLQLHLLSAPCNQCSVQLGQVNMCHAILTFQRQRDQVR